MRVVRFDSTSYPPVLLFLNLVEFLPEFRIFFHSFFNPFAALFAVVHCLVPVPSPERFAFRAPLRVIEFVQEIFGHPKSSWDGV